MNLIAKKLTKLLLFAALGLGVIPASSLAAMELLTSETNSGEQEVYEFESPLVSRSHQEIRGFRQCNNLKLEGTGVGLQRVKGRSMLPNGYSKGHRLRDGHSAPLLT